MDTVKSFFIVEFKVIASGYLFVNSLVQKFAPNVLEIFYQSPAKLVFIFETTKTKEILALLKKNTSKILDFCNFSGDNRFLLDAFYGHVAPDLGESVLVVEAKTLASCFRATKLACDNHNIKLLEIDSGRSLNGKTIAFLSGPKKDCENFKNKIKIKNTSVEILNQMPQAIRSLWAAQ